MPFVITAPEQLLGIEDLTFVTPYEVSASLPVGAWLHDEAGRPAAGCVGVLLDDVLGYALEGEGGSPWSVTTQLSVDLLGPLPTTGALHAVGRQVHQDGLGAVGGGELRDDDGRVLAHAHQRGHFVEGRPDDATLAAGRVEHGVALPDRAGVGGLLALLGAEPAADGVRVAVGPRVTNPLGNLHGGVALALCEAAAALAVPEPSWTSGVRVHYLRPVPSGTALVVESEVVHAGRSLALVEVTARREDGKACVRASVTREGAAR